MRDSAAAVTAHMEWMRQRGLAPSYITARRRILTHLHGHLPRPLLHATARDLSRWRSQLTTAPATVVHAVSHVREFYAWAVRARLIAVSPAAEIPVPRIGRGIPRPVSEARMAAALDRAIQALAYGTVAINGWAALGYGLVVTPWGAFPGSDAADIQSGVGFVHATLMLSRAERTVVRARLVLCCRRGYCQGRA